VALNYKILAACCALVMCLTGLASAQCMFDPAPACQIFSRTPVVFTGVVTRASYSATYQRGEGDDRWDYRDRIAHFTVEETLRGKLGPEVDVIATEILPTTFTLPNGSTNVKTMSDFDCNYRFKEGERYLVYAQFRKANDGTLEVPFNRTRPLADAADDLAFIHGLASAEAGGRIYGQAKQTKRDLSDGGNTKTVAPVTSAKVIAEGPSGKYETYTDDTGRYQLSGVEPGEYSVRLELPQELTSYPPRKIKVDEHGCAQLDFITEPDGRISGKVFDFAGQPAAKMRLDLALAEDKPDNPNPQTFWAYADEAGNYEFKSIPPGRYVLGIRLNAIRDCDFPYARAYYPNTADLSQAKILTLKTGEKITDNNFTLPQPLAARTIEGIVEWPDGRPVSHAMLNVMISDYAYGMGCGATQSDDMGRFSFTLFAGLSYWVNALTMTPDGKQTHSEPIDIPSQGDAKNLRLVITSPSGSCERCRFRYGPHKKKQ
jgi:hypothetical protein